MILFRSCETELCDRQEKESLHTGTQWFLPAKKTLNVLTQPVHKIVACFDVLGNILRHTNVGKQVGGGERMATTTKRR